MPVDKQKRQYNARQYGKDLPNMNLVENEDQTKLLNDILGLFGDVVDDIKQDTGAKRKRAMEARKYKEDIPNMSLVESEIQTETLSKILISLARYIEAQRAQSAESAQTIDNIEKTLLGTISDVREGAESNNMKLSEEILSFIGEKLSEQGKLISSLPTEDRIQKMLVDYYEAIPKPLDGNDGEAGERGEDGEQGEKGEDGADGQDGKSPTHRWVGTELQFQNPDGTWGEAKELQGERGRDGENGKTQNTLQEYLVDGTKFIASKRINFAAGTNMSLDTVYQDGVPTITFSSTGGGSGDLSNLALEEPTGTIDGTNTVFTVEQDYEPNGTDQNHMFFLNGAGLLYGTDNQYEETGSNEFTLANPPEVGDQLFVLYKVLET